MSPDQSSSKQDNRKAWLVLGIIGLFAVTIISCALSLIGSRLITEALARLLGGTQQPIDEMALDELLITVDHLPDDWVVAQDMLGPKFAQMLSGDPETASVELSHPNGESPIPSSVIHVMARYGSAEEAHRGYRVLAQDTLGEMAEWSALEDALSDGSNASEYALHTYLSHESDDAQIGGCRYAARYGRYVTMVLVVVDTRMLSADEAEGLVRMVDDMLLPAIE